MWVVVLGVMNPPPLVPLVVEGVEPGDRLADHPAHVGLDEVVKVVLGGVATHEVRQLEQLMGQ